MYFGIFALIHLTNISLKCIFAIFMVEIKGATGICAVFTFSRVSEQVSKTMTGHKAEDTSSGNMAHLKVL